jgi:hypothetical protein
MKDKEIVKYLDKFYYALCKEFSEEISEGIINDVVKHKLIPYICVNLRVGTAETISKIYSCAKTIKQFKDVINEYVEIIVMSSLMFPESMKVAMQIYDDCNVSKFSKKFNNEMLICLYKHALNYPENMQICMNCIRRHATPELILVRPFMYITDEVDIIQSHFIRGQKERDNLYNLCIDADAINTLIKGVRYYKESNIVICKLSFQTFKENMRYIDMKDKNTRLQIYNEATTFSRWEFIPFIFEEMKPQGDEWEVFSDGLYQGYMNPIFLRTLFHYMERYEIPLETLKNPRNASLLCSEEVAGILEEFNIVESFKIIVSKYLSEYLTPGISNLFYAFSNKKYKYIVDYMHLSASNYNPRFVKERAHLNALVSSGKLGWDNQLRVKWTAFIHFTYEVIEELNILDRCLAKYNSFHSIAGMLTPMIGMRLANDVYNHFKEIRNMNILDKCAEFKGSIEYYRKQILKEVRAEIDIDLSEDKEWLLPENPTLEDYFRYLYQYSNFGNDSYEDGITLLTKLRNAKCFKISDECFNALSKFVPLDDIKNILRIKRVLPM